MSPVTHGHSRSLGEVCLAELDYDFDSWHLGVIVTGERVTATLRGVLFTGGSLRQCSL
jgi:hypothetical protein